MRRLLPYPVLWVALLGGWLLLNDSFGLGQVLVGAIVAGFACRAVAALEPPKPRFGRIGVIVELLGLVIADVVASNIAVLRLIVTGRAPRSAFLTIPLALTDPNGLVILACIVTATPGSAWIHHDSRSSTVIIHVLDTDDEAGWAATLKRNYERRLLEVFR